MASPEAQGFDSVVLGSALRDLRDRDLGVHAVVLVRDGALVLDAAFYPYDGTTPHQVGSITKTVLTTLLGIAVDRGIVSLDDRVLSFFPSRPIANRDARKERMTLRHLADMTSGMACTPADEEATFRAMLASPDWVGFALDLPVTAEPGSTFRYCSPAMHLLSAVLQEAAGVTVLEFARQFLFEPLDISEVRWSADRQGYQHGWSDLYLLPRDLAKLGVLWQRDGAWDGRRIVAARWMGPDADTASASAGAGDYGRGWWIPRDATDGRVEAIGHGGQLLQVRPDLALVAVTLGCGMDPADVVDPLLAGLTSVDRPLLSDPPGEAGLATAVESLRAGPEPGTATGPTSTIRRVSDVTWRLDANPLGIAELRLRLRAKRSEGSLGMAFVAESMDELVPVGLDGRYRVGLDRNRRPIAVRGSWADGRTFVLDVDEIADGRAYELRLRFDPDGRGVTIEGLERGHDTGFVVEGRRTT